MQVELDFTPKTNALIGRHNDPLGWKKCLAELIDNAFDAHATAINIMHASKELIVSDDGCGCSDINQFFQDGSHGSKGGVGIYGVGLKDASLWLWGKTTVHSKTTSKVIRASVDWDRIVKGEVFKTCGDIAANPSKETGTTLTFSKIKRRMQDTDHLLAELGYLFFPAIQGGRQIIFSKKGHRKHPIAAFQFPPLQHIVESEDSIDGKFFSVRAGMVQEGHSNPKPGFTIAFKHRVITTTADGCGSYGTARFAGIVQLADTWKLTRNKDELVADAGLLAERLYQICEETLRLASRQSRRVDLAELENDVSSVLQEAIEEKRREARGKGNEKGPKTPKNTDRKRERASNTKPGDSRLLSKLGRSIRVQFVDGMDFLGRVDFNTDGTLISLSTSEPIVRWAMDNKDRNALIALAASILAIEAANMRDCAQRQRLLPQIEDDDIRDRFLRGFSLYTKHISASIPQ